MSRPTPNAEEKALREAEALVRKILAPQNPSERIIRAVARKVVKALPKSRYARARASATDTRGFNPPAKQGG